MSYTPTNWSSGDTITSAKLNKIEQGIADAQMTVDASPTSGSANPVSSGGVYSELNSLDQNKQDILTFDTVPTSGSVNPVTSGGVHSALNGKQNSLTFDSAPTENSTNPVTSGGVYNAIPKTVRDGTGSESTAVCDDSNVASGRYAFAEGGNTQATAWGSHAEGSGTIASGTNQHVGGKFNVADPTGSKYAEIIGNGKNVNDRSNCRLLDWNGNESLTGTLTLGMDTADETTVSAAELKEMKAVVSGLVSGLTWNAVGDSVTAIGRYLTCVKNATGINPTNCGEASTCLAINNSYADKQNRSMVERVLGLNGNTAYSDADVWTINGGVNDVNYSSAIGALAATGSTFDNTTVYGALQSMVENIMGRRNHPRLLLITPHHSRCDGATMDQIVKAFEDVGAYYGVPVVNLQKEGGINAFNWQHATYPTTSDQLHPNDNGAAMMAAPIVRALKMLLYDYVK